MTIPIIKGTTSLNSYQNLDGSNLTIGGIEEKALNQKGSAGAFLGIGTNFKNEAMVVIDFKGSLNYDKKGLFNQNLRIRNTIGTKNTATQIRYSPITANLPINDKTSFYINPHYSGKYNYKTGEWKNSAGVFSGITRKINEKTSISIEAQRYNLQDIKDNSGKNWGINAIITCNL